jgi:hypothetical protein
MNIKADHYQRIRHEPKIGIGGKCFYCGYAASYRRLHRVGSRCSMCFTYYPIYELDASRRCDDCRP